MEGFAKVLESHCFWQTTVWTTGPDGHTMKWLTLYALQVCKLR